MSLLCLQHIEMFFRLILADRDEFFEGTFFGFSRFLGQQHTKKIKKHQIHDYWKK